MVDNRGGVLNSLHQYLGLTLLGGVEGRIGRVAGCLTSQSLEDIHN